MPFTADLFGNCHSGARRNLDRRLILLDSGLRRNDDFDSFRTSLVYIGSTKRAYWGKSGENPQTNRENEEISSQNL